MAGILKTEVSWILRRMFAEPLGEDVAVVGSQSEVVAVAEPPRGLRSVVELPC